jgi:hypothetical protein
MGKTHCCRGKEKDYTALYLNEETENHPPPK